MKYIRRRNGSASIEFAITSPLYIILFAGILFFGEACFVDQEINMARTYATFSQGDVTDTYINQNILSTFLGQINVTVQGSRSGLVSGARSGVSGQTETWNDHSGSSGNPATIFQTGSFYKNTGPYSNFRMDYTQEDAENSNALWSENRATVMRYNYTPKYTHFIFSNKSSLTKAELLQYDLGGANVPTQDCRGCHASETLGRNNRWDTRDYRSRVGGGLMPGEEKRLWSYLKTRDMRRLAEVLGATPSATDKDLPPADALLPDGSGFDRPDRWNNRHVVNYETSSGF